MPTKKVSEKNTKQEIWEAYNNLIVEVEQQPVLPIGEAKPKVSEALRSLADLKIKIGEDLDKASGDVAREIDKFGTMQTSIAKDKKNMLELFENQRRLLDEEMKRIKAIWDEEKKEREKLVETLAQEETKNRKREEEEYRYNLILTRRKESDDYEAKKIERERVLAQKEKAIKDRSEEIAAMEKEVEKMPAKLEAAVAETKTNITKELTDRYTIEIRELKMTHDHEKKMAELKIANLESMVKAQSTEIESLKRQIENSTKQVKDIAVSVIEGRTAASKAAVVQPQEITSK